MRKINEIKEAEILARMPWKKFNRILNQWYGHQPREYTRHQ